MLVSRVENRSPNLRLTMAMLRHRPDDERRQRPAARVAAQRNLHLNLVVCCLGLVASSTHTVAQQRTPPPQFTEHYVPPRLRQFRVDGAVREAFVYVPRAALETPSPVVFGFHGHGGTMQKSVEMFGFQQHWREAIVVYPQGLPTPSPGDPEGKHPGWVCTGPAERNRDLRFFDVILAALEREYKVDRDRIYAGGNSNGAFFTYTLWSSRAEVLAAVAPAAATTLRLEGKDLTPLPVFCVAGEKDDKVPIASQRETFQQLRALNGGGEPRRGRHRFVTHFPSETGTPVVTFVHPGGHAFPAEAAPLIVEFFKRHSRDKSGAATATPD